MKGTNILNTFWGRPVENSGYLGWVHPRLPLFQYHSQVVDCRGMEDTLQQFEEERVVLGYLQDIRHRCFVKGEGEFLSGNHDVVHVNPDCGPSRFMPSNSVVVQRVHHGLKCGRRISEAEEHYSGFIKPSLCFEHCFVFVSGFDADIVVSPPYIQFCVDHGPFQVSDQRGDERKQVLVAHRPLVNVLVVLHWSKLPVFLFDEEEG